MRSRLFFVIIGIQLVVVVFLFLKIKNKNNNILGVSVNVINSKSIQKTPTEELKHFFEPKPNTTETIQLEWLSSNPKYTINNDSLNERYEYDVVKKQGVFRIITVGDSFTFGVNVSTKDNWTEVLEDKLNKEKTCPGIQKYEVINLGVGSYDTTYELERYKKRGQKYKPDLVIWYVTDLYRITDEIITLADQMNIDEGSNQKKGIFYEAWTKAREELIKKYGEDGLVDYQIAKLKEFRKKYYTRNPLLLVSHWREIEDRLHTNATYYGDTIVPEDKTNLLPDYHFNEVGHEKFADEVVRTLEKKKLLPCN